jgi:hypothetical protein
MTKKIGLTRTLFNRDKFNETINTSFDQLEPVVDPNYFDINLATLDDFWQLYDRFFFDIPKLGDYQSHEYLAKTSGEYANYDQINSEIQALLDEIAALREQNLALLTDALDEAESSQGTNVIDETS